MMGWQRWQWGGAAGQGGARLSLWLSQPVSVQVLLDVETHLLWQEDDRRGPPLRAWLGLCGMSGEWRVVCGWACVGCVLGKLWAL